MAVIELYGDIGCPFTHVSLRKVMEARRVMGRTDSRIRVRPWPLELVNGHPIAPDLVTHEVADIRSQVAPSSFVGFDPNHYPSSTLAALALVEAAYEIGLEKGEELSLGLRNALFEEGLDIGDAGVLAELAKRYEIAGATEEHAAAVLAEWHAGQRRGVRGSPHFFCRDADVFCPALKISHSESGEFRVLDNHEALEAFLVKCLGGPEEGTK